MGSVMAERRALSPGFWLKSFGIEQAELEDLRLEIALEERDCSELLGEIGAEELPRRTQPPPSDRQEIVVTGATRPFQKADAQIFKMNPVSRLTLTCNNVFTPNELQRTAWPVLMQNSNTLLLAPREAGKFMSLLPIITNHALKSRVIIASTRKRCMEYHRALINIPQMSPVVTDVTIGKMLNANVVACPFTSLPEVSRREEKFVCVLDGLDKLTEQGPTSRLGEILRVVTEKSTRVLATARTMSEATSKLTRKIGIEVVVRTKRETETDHSAATRIEMCSVNRRYAVLKRYLKKEIDASSDRVLVFAKNRTAANHLEKTLGEDDIYAQSLHDEVDADRELAETLLRTGNPGVFIVIGSDLSWLQDIPRVDLLIDLRSILSPSAYYMRENRVKPSGIFVAFVSETGTQTAAWLVPLLRLRKKPIRTELLRLYAVYHSLVRSVPEH